ncbi:hypothetical protein GN156_01740 [bacterium LRH843]|nr:hypothetical protein [bacterium LRH843]
MANQVEQCLTEDLFLLLQQARYATIATVDYENNIPNVNAISWVFAPDVNVIRIAVHNRSRILKNIKSNYGVVLTLIADGSTYSITGTAETIVERIDDVPLKLAMVEMNVTEVRDIMFYGGKLRYEPLYENTYDIEAAAKLDRQVMNALKKPNQK